MLACRNSLARKLKIKEAACRLDEWTLVERSRMVEGPPLAGRRTPSRAVASRRLAAHLVASRRLSPVRACGAALWALDALSAAGNCSMPPPAVNLGLPAASRFDFSGQFWSGLVWSSGCDASSFFFLSLGCDASCDWMGGMGLLGWRNKWADVPL